MHDGLGRGTTDQVIDRHFQLFDAGLVQLVDVARGNPAALLNDDLAFVIQDVENGNFTTQTLRNQFQVKGFALNVENVGRIERVQHFFSAVTQRAQQHGSRQLATTVDTHKHGVLRIELEVQP